MPVRTSQEDATSVRKTVSTHVPKILDQAQISTANHQKNLVALYKVQTEAAQYIEYVKKGKGFKPIGERIFEEFLLQMLVRALPMKRGTGQADRVVKFLGAYIKFINEKAAEEKDAEENADDESESTASRFTARLLKFLLKGFLSKDKSIRYRVIHAVAEMVAHLGEIDEDIYKELRTALLDRVNDKEASVRVQTVIALCKLCGSEDPSELSEDEPAALDLLLEILAHDSSPEVRRAALLNIPINSKTLPHILERTRDTDTTLRKFVYHSVLAPNVMMPDTDRMGPAHPRAMSIADRELIIRNGLGDREINVRNAAATLLVKWVEAVTESEPKKKEEGEQAKTPGPKIESGLVALLKMLDLTESVVAVDAILSVFATKPGIFDKIKFDNDYWANLTPETAFLARVFVEHCKTTEDEAARLEDALPVVTALAFRIQEAYNDLIEHVRTAEEEALIRDLDEQERTRVDEELHEKEFVTGEMLKLAVSLDYSDEIGRRKMFQLVRDMLSQEELPESFLWKCLDVLRELSANERDLIRVVVEIIQDLRDSGDEDEQQDNADADAETNYDETPTTARPPRPQVNNLPAEQTPEQQARADAIDLRCLSLCIGMLERVNGKLEENSTLDGILKTLIIPSVRRKELAFRQKGLVSLGLTCLIDKNYALKSINFFMKQVTDSSEELNISVLQVVFDMLMVHENDLLKKAGGDNITNIPDYLTGLLAAETSTKVQALLCIGMSKLAISGMVTDLRVVQNLIMTYLSPNTAHNHELRQCLSFFLPAYSYSSPINQKNMREIFIETFIRLAKARKDLDDDEEMISASQIGALFIDLTDPQKLKRAIEAAKEVDSKCNANDFIHLDLASDIFKALLGKKRQALSPEDKFVELELEKEDIRVLCQLLPKLHIPDSVDDYQIMQVKLWMNKIRSHRPLRDVVANNAFTKFETTISKKFESQLKGLNEEEVRKLGTLDAMFQDLDDIIPLDDDDEIPSIDLPKKGRKRRSTSVATTSTEGEDLLSGNSRHGRSKAKRPRLSNSDDDSDGEISTPPASVKPRRTLPKRASRKPVPVIEISSDSDEELTPGPRARPRRTKVKEEEQLDEEIDELLDNDENGQSIETPFDSIMDDSHDEEEEVNDLLAEE